MVQVIFGEPTTTPPAHPLVGFDLTFPIRRLLKAKVVADGEAVLLAAPGKVRTIVPPVGIVVVGVNVIVCMAVIGLMSTSDPAPPAVTKVPPRYTVVRPADWEAIGILLSTIPPAPFIIFAESEARYLEALSNIEREPTPAAALALRGLDAEGLEVEIVSLASDREAA